MTIYHVQRSLFSWSQQLCKTHTEANYFFHSVAICDCKVSYSIKLTQQNKAKNGSKDEEWTGPQHRRGS